MAFRNRTVFEIAQSFKAFLNVEVGIIHDAAPDSEAQPVPPKAAGVPELPASQGRELEQIRRQLAKREQEIANLRASLAPPTIGAPARRLESQRIVWIFGSNRTGSTWLSSMMGEIEGHAVWDEPLVGKLFGDLYYLGAAGQREVRHYILGSQHKNSWLRSLRSFVLSEAEAHFPEIAGRGFLIVKEPNGSIGAPLLMEALPESRMVLLVRDPRDAVASNLDSHRKGSWQYEGAPERGWKREALADNQPDAFVKRRATNYMRNVGNAREAYEAHEGPKTLVKYEDLRADTLRTMKRLYSSLEIPVDEKRLARAVEKHAWENISDEEKGQGKFYRKATPGGWREDLTPAQTAAVERITAPLLEEFYPGQRAT